MRPANDQTDEQQRYEQNSAALIGQRALAVSYWDVHNYSEQPRTWDYGDWHHAVMGVELVTDRGPSSIVWTNTFYPYGVEIFPEPISNQLRQGPDGCEGWTVETHGHWRSRLSSPILATDTFWERIDVGRAETYTVPVALRLDFEAGPVWMVAAMPGWPDVEDVSVPGDEIMVVFSPDRMRKIGFPETGFLRPEPTT